MDKLDKTAMRYLITDVLVVIIALLFFSALIFLVPPVSDRESISRGSMNDYEWCLHVANEKYSYNAVRVAKAITYCKDAYE